MTNPISTTSALQLPPISYPLLDPASGGPSIAWYQAFLSFYQRTGSASGLNNTDLSSAVEAASIAAANASNAAAAAHLLATEALSVASSADSTAVAANTTANTAETAITALAPTVLLKVNNLSDVASITAARSRLDIAVVPYVFHITTVGSGISYCSGVVTSLQLPANLTQTLCFSRTAPTHNATFSLYFWRGGLQYPIGSITLLAGSRTAYVASTLVAGLIAGDVLELVTPIVADPTLAQVGITLALLLQ